MVIMEWNAVWETGVPAINRQHRELLERANRLLAGINGGPSGPDLEETLFHLAQYTDFHFREEEAAMARTKFPGLREHREAHDGMRERVAAMAETLERDPAGLCGDLMAYFYDWLVNHMQTFDLDLARHLQAH